MFVLLPKRIETFDRCSNHEHCGFLRIFVLVRLRPQRVHLNLFQRSHPAHLQDDHYRVFCTVRAHHSAQMESQSIDAFVARSTCWVL